MAAPKTPSAPAQQDPDQTDGEPARKRRGLGRGLESLLGEYLRETDPSVPSMTTNGDPARPTEIPLACISANPEQPRRDIERSDLEELSKSIRNRGVLQPILLRPDPKGGPGQYQIVAGERRWRAAKMAGLERITAVVRAFDDETVAEIAIVENVQREDLNPIEEAIAYRQLIDKYGQTQESLAGRIGKSRSHIANTMRLLRLPARVQARVRSGALSAGHARAMLPSSNTESLAERIKVENLSVRDVEEAVRAETRPATPKPVPSSDESGTVSGNENGPASSSDALHVFDITTAQSGGSKSGEVPVSDQDPDIRALEHSLFEMTGLRFGVRRDGNAGEVWIGFANMQELDAICRLLSGSIERRSRAAG